MLKSGMINRHINRQDNKLAPWDRGMSAALLKKLKQLPQIPAQLINAGNQLGFDLNNTGICKGLGAAGADAFWVSVLTDEDGLKAYFERFQEIAYSKLSQPERDKKLTQSHLNLFGFFERVKLIQESQNYKPYHSQLIPSDQAFLPAKRLSAIEELVRPIAMVTPENNPIKILNIDTLIGGYTLSELNQYLDCLSSQLGDYPFELSLSSGKHAINLCFCPTKKEWLVFDVNHYPLSVFNKEASHQLAETLKKLLFGGDKYTIFSTTIRTADIFEEAFKNKYAQLNENNSWKNLHEINPHRATIQNQDGETLLYIAAYDGHLSCVQALIAAGAKVNQAIPNSDTPLFIATHNGHLSCVESLIAAKADVNQATSSGVTPLFIAAYYGHLSCIQTLIAAGAKVNQAKSNGTTPLNIAAQKGHLPCVEALIAAKADVNQATSHGATPLISAAQNGYPSCVQALITAGAKVNQAIPSDGFTSLGIAAYNGHLSCVEALITANADVNQATLNGTTPLFLAAQNGHLSCVKALIAANAETNQARSDGVTPLFIAAQNGHLACVEVLIAANADVNKAASDGATPLYIAAQEGHLACVEVLIAANADVNKAASDDATPLYIAAQKGHLTCVEVLIAANADVNQATSDGTTPLIIAAELGHLSCVEILLAAGADVSLMYKGLTAAQIARDNGHHEVAILIEQHAPNFTQKNTL